MRSTCVNQNDTGFPFCCIILLCRVFFFFFKNISSHSVSLCLSSYYFVRRRIITHYMSWNRPPPPPPQWRNAINAHARQSGSIVAAARRRRRLYYTSYLFPSSPLCDRPLSTVNRADAHKGKCARPNHDLDVRACERRRRRRTAMSRRPNNNMSDIDYCRWLLPYLPADENTNLNRVKSLLIYCWLSIGRSTNNFLSCVMSTFSILSNQFTSVILCDILYCKTRVHYTGYTCPRCQRLLITVILLFYSFRMERLYTICL